MTRLKTLGIGVETQENKNKIVPLSKKDKYKNLLRVGHTRLLQHYWYKFPVLHLVKYYLTGAW